MAKNRFATPYDRHEIRPSPSGSKIEKQYQLVESDSGEYRLECVGEINIYDEIQAHAEDTELKRLINRYLNGDPEALNQRQGTYGDMSDMPSTYIEAVKMVDRAKEVYYKNSDLRDKYPSFNDFLKNYVPDSQSTAEVSKATDTESKGE